MYGGLLCGVWDVCEVIEGLFDNSSVVCGYWTS